MCYASVCYLDDESDSSDTPWIIGFQDYGYDEEIDESAGLFRKTMSFKSRL